MLFCCQYANAEQEKQQKPQGLETSLPSHTHHANIQPCTIQYVTFNLQRPSSRNVQIAHAESAYATSDAASTGVKP
jgi:hypothetical protein